MRLPEDVEQVLLDQGKIAAIKQLRESQSLSLKEAKEWVESHPSEYRAPVNPSPVASNIPWGRIMLALLIVGTAVAILATGE